MKRTKYPIHEDFKKWANFNPPLNKFILFFSQKILRLIFLNQKSDKDCFVKKIKIPISTKKEVQALIYCPKDLIDTVSPCLVYYHGGGFVMPGAPYHFNNARRYSLGAKCKVIFVDYPLAPKNKYPIPVNACFDAYKWIINNSNLLKINKTKIAVGGDSAGGNLATVVSMMANDKKITTPCAQMLIYPAIGVESKTESMKVFHDTPMCNSNDYDKYCKYYLSSQNDKMDKYISAIKAESFNIFPPTYIETAEFDCLKDEAIIFGEKLKEAGVKTIINNTLQTMHAYDIVENSSITKENLQKRISFLQTYLYNKNQKDC